MAIRQKTPRITFDSAAAMLDTFGMQQGGSQYRRLVDSFQRIFGATIYFGSDSQRLPAAVIHRARFNFMSEARIWYSRHSDQRLLPGDCQNTIILSDEFYREILSHPIPTDLEAAKVLSARPAALDLFTWLLTGASPRVGASGFRYSESWGSSVSSVALIMPDLKSFARSWKAA